MRICFVGDSHLGHVKPAWDELAQAHPQLSVDFKIERTYGENPLVIRDSGLGEQDVPAVFEDIRLVYGEILDCARYEVFVVFGMHYSMNTLARTYPRFCSDHQARGAGTYMLSREAYQASANELLMSHKAGRIIRALRARTDKPIVYVQQPLPLEWIAARSDLDFGFYQDVLGNADDAGLAAVYANSLAHLDTLGVHVRPQPAATRSGNIFTQARYGLADAADTSPESLYSRGDYYHMNKDYGLLALDDLFTSETAALFRRQ
ncbi:hypothetical protein JOF48_002832 [Arthrobacter stackebrandtii]|uniref:SGNH/GDSL hydrolase family protein n=1 Tax=Arthrobacter stackebrandtii TaxID=272161 RepID=A0ABS4YZ13_9MICC|nr:hypothetical protein [Arthrobacter stackebrandtii]MBP2414033.1 hypothetical protein [Arthrobacter stackebrandtii]PYG99037.1 hypothetical protein CVV67_17595 [Arthrobacter stackebrandtii]